MANSLNNLDNNSDHGLEITLIDSDLSDPASIERYAKQLEGMTFRDVLDLGIAPEGVEREYNNKRYKGGMGTLIEERFFGYKANSDQEADLAEAGVEIKASPLDLKQDGSFRAGERLVLTMIPLDRPIENDFFKSHAWEKCRSILLIYYLRDRELDHYDQVIKYVKLISPIENDLKIIRDDYSKIATIVKDGRAEELSESLTLYLGACTKGATAESSWVNQYYPPHTPAKKRAFCFKQSYMNYVLNTQILGNTSKDEKVLQSKDALETMTFEDYVLSQIDKHIGKTDKQLCEEFGLRYKNNKRQWSQITYAMLGVRGDKAEEFEKANISVRAVRVEERGTIKESLSLDTFKFKDLIEEEWEDSTLRSYFEETRFLFVSFLKKRDCVELSSAKFWSMPAKDLDGALKKCWERTKQVIQEGVDLQISIGSNGDVTITNNLPKKTDPGAIAHVRPHASQRGYILKDGKRYGDPEKYGDELPDGQVMTKQSFWLNSEYIYEVVKLPELAENDND